MKCPHCDASTEVKDSRPLALGASVQRRRACPACHERFSTFEMIVDRGDGLDGAARWGRAHQLWRSVQGLPPEDQRLLLILIAKLTGKPVSATIYLERAA